MLLIHTRSPKSTSTRVFLLVLISLICAGCNTGHENQVGNLPDARNASPEPLPTQNAADVVAPPIVDTTYSDAPECNARLHRIAEEVLPCLNRVEPELAQQLKVAIANARNAPRLTGNLSDRPDVLMMVEEVCLDHWRQMLHQLPNRGPVGECLLQD